MLYHNILYHTIPYQDSVVLTGCGKTVVRSVSRRNGEHCLTLAGGQGGGMVEVGREDEEDTCIIGGERAWQ